MSIAYSTLTADDFAALSEDDYAALLLDSADVDADEFFHFTAAEVFTPGAIVAGVYRGGSAPKKVFRAGPVRSSID